MSRQPNAFIEPTIILRMLSHTYAFDITIVSFLIVVRQPNAN